MRIGPRFRSMAPRSVLFLLSAVILPHSSFAAQPNVLFIAVDDLRPELGCYGAAHIKSPQHRPAGAKRTAVRARLLPGGRVQSVAQQRAERLPAGHDGRARQPALPAPEHAGRAHAAAAFQKPRLHQPLARQKSSITAKGSRATTRNRGASRRGITASPTGTGSRRNPSTTSSNSRRCPRTGSRNSCAPRRSRRRTSPTIRIPMDRPRPRPSKPCGG